MRKLAYILLFVIVPILGTAQIRYPKGSFDTLKSFTDASFLLLNDSVRVVNYVELDSVKVPPCPPQGRINLLCRGISGLFVQFSNCSRVRLDSTWDSVRVAHIADSLRGFDSTKYKFRTDSVANSGYLPVHRLADSTASLRTDLKRKDDSTASTGWLPVHRLSDSTAVLRTDLKRKDDTTSGVGYVRNHQLSDSTSALRTDLKRKDDSTANTGYSPVHRLPDSTAVLRTDLKRKDDSTANSGYSPVHRLPDSTAVLRTDLKRKDDTTSGVGYARNHQLNDSTSALRTDLARQSTTITVNGTANQITSSAGAQDLSANRTWTFAIAGTYVGQASIITLGTITTGVWHGTSIDTTYTEAKVKKLIAGTNITLSPSTGIGTVTVNASSNADSSRASSISDSTKAVAAANVKSPQNLTVGTSLSITSGTGTAATLLALGLNTIQGIRTADSPTFTGLTLSGMTAGSVIYAGTSGVLSQDNSNFFWDATNHRLGIGAMSPGSKITVNGTVQLTGWTTPSSGAGLELGYGAVANTATIQAYDRSGAAYKTLFLQGDQLQLSVSGTEMARLDGSRLRIKGITSGEYPTLGTAAGSLFLSGEDYLWGTYYGTVSATGNCWFQVMRNDGATAYNMILQPVGGNVGIGTTGPTTMFSVAEKFGVTSAGQFGFINNSGTVPAQEGHSVSLMTDTVKRSGKTATLAAAGFNNADLSGLYRVSMYVYTTTAGTSGTVSITIRWNDGAAESFTTSNLTFGVLGAFVQAQVLCRTTNDVAPTYETTVTTAIGSPVYELDLVCEHLF